MIGVVSQEPTLFETTIMENIRYGRLDWDKKNYSNIITAFSCNNKTGIPY